MSTAAGPERAKARSPETKPGCPCGYREWSTWALTAASKNTSAGGWNWEGSRDLNIGKNMTQVPHDVFSLMAVPIVPSQASKQPVSSLYIRKQRPDETAGIQT